MLYRHTSGMFESLVLCTQNMYTVSCWTLQTVRMIIQVNSGPRTWAIYRTNDSVSLWECQSRCLYLFAESRFPVQNEHTLFTGFPRSRNDDNQCLLGFIKQQPGAMKYSSHNHESSNMASFKLTYLLLNQDNFPLPSLSSWWFRSTSKICVKLGIFPK